MCLGYRDEILLSLLPAGCREQGRAQTFCLPTKPAHCLSGQTGKEKRKEQLLFNFIKIGCLEKPA